MLDPDPDPHKTDADPKHCNKDFELFKFFKYEFAFFADIQ
jgi:hypothetical protein